jgi:hypothetical protein
MEEPAQNEDGPDSQMSEPFIRGVTADDVTSLDREQEDRHIPVTTFSGTAPAESHQTLGAAHCQEKMSSSPVHPTSPQLRPTQVTSPRQDTTQEVDTAEHGDRLAEWYASPDAPGAKCLDEEPFAQRPSFHGLLTTLADDLHDLLKGLAQQGESMAAKNLELSAENSRLHLHLHDLAARQTNDEPTSDLLLSTHAKNLQQENIEGTTASKCPYPGSIADCIDVDTQTDGVSVKEAMEPNGQNGFDTWMCNSISEACNVLQSEMQMAFEAIRCEQEKTFKQLEVLAKEHASERRSEKAEDVVTELQEKEEKEREAVSSMKPMKLSRIGPEKSKLPPGIRTMSKIVTDAGSLVHDSPQPSLTTDQKLDSQNDWQAEFAISMCPFVTTNGKINVPPSDLEDMVPCLYKMSQTLKANKLDSDETHKQDCCHRFVDSKGFKTLSMVIIMINFGVMVVQTDWKMTNVGAADPATFFVLSILFTVYYVFECGTQAIVKGKHYFFGDEWCWAWFDTIIVSFSVFEIVVNSFGDDVVNLSFLRALRFLRISKLLRMFYALRMFKEIRLMVDMFAGSFTFFVWCAMMLMLFLSMFAIFFVQGANAFLEAQLQNRDAEDEEIEKVREYFGNTGEAMLTLLKAATGGNDWDEYYTYVKLLGLPYRIAWMFFIMFSVISFFNIISGVFCEKAMSLAKPTMKEQMHNRQERDIKDAIELSVLLNKYVHHCQTYKITASEFDSFLKADEPRSYFEVRGMSVASAARFFALLLKVRNEEYIDFGTFISSVVQLDGTASSIDLHVLQVEMKALQKASQHLIDHLIGDHNKTSEDFYDYIHRDSAVDDEVSIQDLASRSSKCRQSLTE